MEQRLHLGNAASELLDDYRVDEIDLETLKAFSVTTDHDRHAGDLGAGGEPGLRASAWQMKRLLPEERVPGRLAHGALRRRRGLRGRWRPGAARPLRRRARSMAGRPALLIEFAMKKPQAAADEFAIRWKITVHPTLSGNRRGDLTYRQPVEPPSEFRHG